MSSYKKSSHRGGLGDADLAAQGVVGGRRDVHVDHLSHQALARGGSGREVHDAVRREDDREADRDQRIDRAHHHAERGVFNELLHEPVAANEVQIQAPRARAGGSSSPLFRSDGTYADDSNSSSC